MITYSDNKHQDAKDVANVFKESGIRRPYEDIDGKMIGVARALTDFSYCCYLSDLAVDMKYQKHGVGRELVKLVQAKIGDECALILLSAPGAMEYYPKIGFDSIDNAFVIKRKS